MIHLIPKDGARVRDPRTKKILDADGVTIPKLDTYWFRRLQDGEVMEAPKAKIESESKKDKKEKN